MWCCFFLCLCFSFHPPALILLSDPDKKQRKKTTRPNGGYGFLVWNCPGIQAIISANFLHAQPWCGEKCQNGVLCTFNFQQIIDTTTPLFPMLIGLLWHVSGRRLDESCGYWSSKDQDMSWCPSLHRQSKASVYPTRRSWVLLCLLFYSWRTLQGSERLCIWLSGEIDPQEVWGKIYQTALKLPFCFGLRWLLYHVQCSVNSLFCLAHGCTNSRFITAELQIPRTREHVFLGSVWRAHWVQARAQQGRTRSYLHETDADWFPRPVTRQLPRS